MKKLKLILSFLIFLIAATPRFYKLESPVADWHSWRQADTAAVARNFLKFGFNPWLPRYDDLSNIASGRDNPQGYRLVEFPLYQLTAASLAKIFPQLSIEIWLRATTITASSFSTALIFLLVSRLLNWQTGLFSGIIFAILPYSIYYGRIILPETFAVFWAVFSLWLLSGKRGGWSRLGAAAVCGAIALLVKPTTGFLLLPSLYLIWRKPSNFKARSLGLFVFILLSVTPFLLWRNWISRFPEGIPAYTWLLNAGNIRFKGAWFYWLFAERLGKLILGYWGLILFGLGLVVKPSQEEGWFFRWLLIGTLLYLIVFAAGNVQHDYYQVLLLPVVSIYVGKGFVFLLTNKVFSKAISYQLSAISFLMMVAFSWYTIRTYYWTNRPDIVAAGKLADKLIPPDAKVIAPYNGDTTFLYQTNRQGWPIGFDIEKKITMGATHYVTVSPTDNDLETKQLAECFSVLVRNDRYAIINLTKPTKACVIKNP
ncbi:MAG: ArnT family glycosyltransferase [Patescibacteria group bacterium]